MKAAPQEQRLLLDLQAVDTSIAQLAHRRRQLPEHAQVQAAQAQRAAVMSRLTAVKTRTSDLEGEQTRAEADLVPVRERLDRDRQRVDAGILTDPKQLTAMLDEIAHLERRISDLEDAELEVMERLEASQGEVTELTARKAASEDGLRELMARRDEQVALLDAELAELQTERAAIAAKISADLLSLYAKIAERSAGQGAALLDHGRCSGCQLTLNAADLDRFRAAAADEVLRCEECNRILVRA